MEKPNFNSIKVQLKRIDEPANDHIYLFQFHKGTIKALGMQEDSLKGMNFNSIKVQLKQISLL